MAQKLYEESNIQAIAAAIRSKNGSGTTYKTSEMATAIEALGKENESSKYKIYNFDYVQDVPKWNCFFDFSGYGSSDKLVAFFLKLKSKDYVHSEPSTGSVSEVIYTKPAGTTRDSFDGTIRKESLYVRWHNPATIGSEISDNVGTIMSDAKNAFKDGGISWYTTQQYAKMVEGWTYSISMIFEK